MSDLGVLHRAPAIVNIPEQFLLRIVVHLIEVVFFLSGWLFIHREEIAELTFLIIVLFLSFLLCPGLQHKLCTGSCMIIMYSSLSRFSAFLLYNPWVTQESSEVFQWALSLKISSIWVISEPFSDLITTKRFTSAYSSLWGPFAGFVVVRLGQVLHTVQEILGRLLFYKRIECCPLLLSGLLPPPSKSEEEEAVALVWVFWKPYTQRDSEMFWPQNTPKQCSKN